MPELPTCRCGNWKLPRGWWVERVALASPARWTWVSLQFDCPECGERITVGIGPTRPEDSH
jgi:hypothetical protein